MQKNFTTAILTVEEAKEKLSGINKIRMMNEIQSDPLEVLKTFKNFDPEIEVIVSTNGEEYLFEYIMIYIKVGDYYLRPYKRSWNDKTFAFTLKNNTKVDYWRFNGTEPNKVGKPTGKKLQDWLDHLLAEEEAKQSFCNKVDKNKSEALNQLIKLFGDSIEWDVYHSHGKIVKNGIVLTFYFLTDGTPRYTIEVDSFTTSKYNKLWLFQLLSDNALINYN